MIKIPNACCCELERLETRGRLEVGRELPLGRSIDNILGGLQRPAFQQRPVQQRQGV